MAKCLNVDCSNEVVSQEGKREKKTCSDSCRQKVWQKNKQLQQFIKIPYEEWQRLTNTENELLKKAIEASTKPIRDKIYTELMPLIRITPDSKKEFVVDVPLNKEFRPIMKGEEGLQYTMAKREWKLNNQ